MAQSLYNHYNIYYSALLSFNLDINHTYFFINKKKYYKFIIMDELIFYNNLCDGFKNNLEK